MTEKINKLQIRAKVLEIIKSYNTDDDFNSDLHAQNLAILTSFNEKTFILDILLKELITQEEIFLEAIKYLLIDFAQLTEIEESIWSLLQNTQIPDKKKEVYLQLLRGLGGKVDVSVLMNCMQDFASVVDEQTQGLLELATVNPEAQIDFLDFLFSLKQQEQIQLINSLQNDFKGDELANVLAPCLRVNISNEVKQCILNVLAQSNSYLAVTPLKKFLLTNTNDDLKKTALKALNQLRNQGIDIENIEILKLRENEICKESTFYKAFIGQVDGSGNQGLIFSRITEKKQIIMYSVVINVTDGLIDCFGLYQISLNDFEKVITRFKADDIVISIPASIAKYKLLQAENINIQKGTSLPYEYICWDVYSCDIDPIAINYNDLKTNEIKDYTPEIYSELYDTESFDSWFFEYDDNIEVQNLINFIVQNIKNDREDLLGEIENKIEEIYYKVFSLNKLEEYSNMLKEIAYIFDKNKNISKANIAMNLSSDIINGETKFLKDVIRRSILQYLASIIAEDEATEENEKNIFSSQTSNKQEISVDDAYMLFVFLEKEWN